MDRKIDRREALTYLAGSIVSSKNYMTNQYEQREQLHSFEVMSITFHEVANSDQILQTIYPLLDAGYLPISIHNVIQSLNNQIDLSKKKSLLITLDDGLKSQKNAVLGANQAEKSWGVAIPLLFAVMTQFNYYNDDQIPLSTPSYNDHVHEYLTKKDILQIIENPSFDLANHTLNHADLTLLNDNDLTGELTIAQRRLSHLYREAGREKVPRILIYPFGRYNHHVLQTVSNLDFEAAFTTKNDTQYSAKKRFRLGRIGKT
jgi:peptidoglycan/xylan/chitin deacetylase (PgdA/CDA1 family)